MSLFAYIVESLVRRPERRRQERRAIAARRVGREGEEVDGWSARKLERFPVTALALRASAAARAFDARFAPDAGAAAHASIGRATEKLVDQASACSLKERTSGLVTGLIAQLQERHPWPEGGRYGVELWRRVRQSSDQVVPQVYPLIGRLAAEAQGPLSLEDARALIEYLACVEADAKAPQGVQPADRARVSELLEASCSAAGMEGAEVTTAVKEVCRLPWAASLLARIARHGGDFAAAKLEYDAARTLAIPAAPTHRLVDEGEVHLGLGRWRDALKLFEAARKADEPGAAELALVTRICLADRHFLDSDGSRSDACARLVALHDELTAEIEAAGPQVPEWTIPTLVSLRRRLPQSPPPLHGLAAHFPCRRPAPVLAAELYELFAESGSPASAPSPATANRDARDAVALGRSLLRRGRLSEFTVVFDDVPEPGSELRSPGLALLQADYFLRTGRASEAHDALERSYVDPHLIRYLAELRVRGALAAEDSDRARKLLEGAPAMLLAQPLQDALGAELNQQLQDWSAATEQLRDTLAATPASGAAWANAGFTLACLCLDDDAREAFRRAADLDPLDVYAAAGKIILDPDPLLLAALIDGEPRLAALLQPVRSRLASAGRADLVATLPPPPTDQEDSL